MPPTGRDCNESGRGLRLSRRGLLAALGAGTLASTSAAAGRQEGTSWPLFQYDLTNTGHAPSNSGPTQTAGARWSYLDGERFESEPVVTSDAVYAADSGARTIVAVDRATGSERWRVETSVGAGRMTYADGTLFVPADGLQARSPADGSVQWRVGVRSPTSVAVRGDYVYVAAQTGVYRVDRVSKAVDWHVDRVKQLVPGLAINANYVYAAGRQYGQIIALNPAAGSRRWLRRIEGTATGVPTATEKLVLAPTETKLVAMSYESGVPEWEYDAAVGSSVAVADGAVYGSTTGEEVVSLDLATGEPRWQQSVAPGSNPPVLVGGLLYVAGTDGTIAALSPDDGTVVWSDTLGGGWETGVAAADQELYAGDSEGQLAALAAGASGGFRTATPTPEPNPTEAEEATPEPEAEEPSTATPTSTGGPGFGLLAGITAAGAAAALRRLTTDTDD